ncbi:MAG: hypothetical protein CMJ41_03250 [Phycisphaerae bacterium]|nr:hypothetical protein [Phycisphaerae bacterium]HAI13473.1 hypothetical protein [Phycisphaerales bacterium]
MISSPQIRAARVMLNWSQKELADVSGVSINAIAKIESEKVQPRESTISELQKTLEAAGIQFLKNGVQFREDLLTHIPTKDAFIRILDDVYHSLKDSENKELLYVCVDDRLSPQEVIDAELRLRKAGIQFKTFIEEGNTHILYPLEEYRYVSQDYFNNNTLVIYEDKIATMVYQGKEETGGIIIHSPSLSQSLRNICQALWITLEKPTKTTADRTYD